MISRRTFQGGIAAAALTPRSAMSEPITAIDSHAHVLKRGLKLAPSVRDAPDHDATHEDCIKVLDTNGISDAVLIQPSFLGTDNSHMS